MDEQHWPEIQPVIWQNEERRRSKQIRKEYFKVMQGRVMVVTFLSWVLWALSALQVMQIFENARNYVTKSKQGNVIGRTACNFYS